MGFYALFTDFNTFYGCSNEGSSFVALNNENYSIVIPIKE